MAEQSCKIRDGRDLNLLRVYSEILSRSSFPVNMDDICRRLSHHPADRFWVSNKRATEMFFRLERGDRLEGMLPMRREMYLEIHRRVCRLRSLFPRWNTTALIDEVIRSQAPSFFLEPESVKIILHRAKKRRRARS